MTAANWSWLVAAVIGHEVSHVLAHHSAERYSNEMATNLGSQVLGAAVGVDPQLLGMAGQVFFLLPYSRRDESEADQIGLDLMAKAGFDPRQALTLWQNMSRLGGNKPGEMLSTHPSDETRMRQISAHLAVAVPLYEQARAAGLKPSCTM